ncbi:MULTISPECIES: hypothetical protein [Cryobacterium]|uniref:Uncharacterized protein n=1 Tax=Cryobacterium breve TaxID=1259258 RepID=A0ABY2J4E5_9MICO|nr:MULTISPECIES: hypothetical protein [Cryobacterium]TFC92058.1 hypothetical protein E3T20_12145 [Cryobacterium sp. TmT3-12]TFC99803.1 hypothetical protein E3O65_05360 [Cryobacterium breve]
MTNLKIVEPSTVPAAGIVDGAPHAIVVDYSHIETAAATARRAYEGASDSASAIRELSDSVFALSGILAEIVAGLHNREIAVINYPVEGAHLD